MRRARGLGFSAEVVDRAKELLYDYAPAEVARILEREESAEVPSDDTLARWAKKLPPRASDRPWSPLRASLEDCLKLAPQLTADWPTDSEAGWMLRVQAWAPKLSPERVGQLGRYIAASDEDEQHRLVRSLFKVTGDEPLDAEEWAAGQSAGTYHGGTAVAPEGGLPASVWNKGGAAVGGPER